MLVVSFLLFHTLMSMHALKSRSTSILCGRFNHSFLQNTVFPSQIYTPTRKHFAARAPLETAIYIELAQHSLFFSSTECNRNRILYIIRVHMRSQPRTRLPKLYILLLIIKNIFKFFFYLIHFFCLK